MIFLNAKFEKIIKQLEEDHSRPLFKALTSAKKLYDFRLPLYLNYADAIIDLDFRSIDEIALKIKEMTKR